jgi:pimeloyl-ACP methyl ester carboxylesterase
MNYGRNPAPKLDPDEQHFRTASHHAGRHLFLRYLPPRQAAAAQRDGLANVVLYVHGGTFPSALSIAYRCDGVAWRDELCAAGFHVWGLDFHGFGTFSDPYPQMLEPAENYPPLGQTEDAGRQLEAAVRFISEHHRVPRISLIAHSWGTIVAGDFAGRCPELVDRMVYFGPIAQRQPRDDLARLPAWRLISLQEQWDRFTGDVPPDEPSVLRDFQAWGEAYLDADPESRTRTPAAVKTPCGAFQDIFDAWGGKLAYDPGLVRAPVAIIRGEWDSMCTDEDAKLLFTALRASPMRRDIKISRATHLAHLEAGRHALYREAETFLRGGDHQPISS